jgi:glutamine synthetase
MHIEALTMLDMAKKQVLPSVLAYERKLVDMALNKKRLDESIDRTVELDLINKLSALAKNLYASIDILEKDALNTQKGANSLEVARYYREKIFFDMQALREDCDKLETLVDKNDWPFPTYADLLYSIK